LDVVAAQEAMLSGYANLLHRPAVNSSWKHPRIVALGGDHSIVYPILRGIKSAYGPVAVLHFDAHLDSRCPAGIHCGV
jgi:agmatinase